jgi:hypothetical protein
VTLTITPYVEKTGLTDGQPLIGGAWVPASDGSTVLLPLTDEVR